MVSAKGREREGERKGGLKKKSDAVNGLVILDKKSKRKCEREENIPADTLKD